MSGSQDKCCYCMTVTGAVVVGLTWVFSEQNAKEFFWENPVMRGVTIAFGLGLLGAGCFLGKALIQKYRDERRQPLLPTVSPFRSAMVFRRRAEFVQPGVASVNPEPVKEREPLNLKADC